MIFWPRCEIIIELLQKNQNDNHVFVSMLNYEFAFRFWKQHTHLTTSEKLMLFDSWTLPTKRLKSSISKANSEQNEGFFFS